MEESRPSHRDTIDRDVYVDLKSKIEQHRAQKRVQHHDLFGLASLASESQASVRLNTARFNSNKPRTERESEQKPQVRNKSLLWRSTEKRQNQA